MNYQSSNNFIKKLETSNYMLGSFDVYINDIKKIIKQKGKKTDEEIDEFLKKFPTSFRAAIVEKNTNELIGFIGAYNFNNKEQKASVYSEVNKALDEDRRNEIFDEYNKFLDESLNIKTLEEKTFITPEKFIKETRKFISSNIIVPKNYLKKGIEDKVLEEYKEQYNIPNLQMPATINVDGRVLGIIGLSNLIWSNKRANLNLYFDKGIDDNIMPSLGSQIIDDYLEYLHDSNLYNINAVVSGSNKDLLEILNNSNMNYYGSIPYSEIYNNNVETKYMFQHTPNMKKEHGIYLPENNMIPNIETNKEEKKILNLSNGYRAISPRAFEEENIDLKEVVKGHIKALQNRDNFSIPLGEDKYFIQEGNGNYGISKALANYSYVLFDSNNNYSGYINILRENANGKNAEIEIGIKPEIQNIGLGKDLINSFYDELFRRGYASITSAIFEFNKPSLKLHEKVANFNGTRIDSYYINGRLWDMNFYSKVNPELESSKTR